MIKKILLLSAVAILSLGYAYSQTADEIIEKSMKASGTEKAKAFKTLKVEGKNTVPQMNMTLPMSIYYKAPDKFCMVVEAMGSKIIQTIDGEKGWIINPMTGISDPQDLPKEKHAEVKQMIQLLFGPFQDYKKEKDKIELAGKEDLDGKTFFKLKFTLKDGQEGFFYLDAITYLPEMITILVKNEGDKQSEVHIKVKDKKKVKGVIFLSKIEVEVNGQTQGIFEYEKIEADTDIDDYMFAKPAPAPKVEKIEKPITEKDEKPQAEKAVTKEKPTKKDKAAKKEKATPKDKKPAKKTTK